LPFAVRAIGLNNTIGDAYKTTGGSKLYEQSQTMYWTSMGLTAVMGVFLAESFYRIGRYVWEANKESSPFTAKAPDTEAASVSGSDADLGAAAPELPPESPAAEETPEEESVTGDGE
jgi:hypothetical protein